MIGADRGTFYLTPGDWQIGASYRWFRADEQYRGTRLSQPVTRLGTNVISKLQLLDFGGTRQIDPQWSLSFNVPITLYASSSRALPAGVAGSPRFVQSTKGLGDISLVARRWMLPVERGKTGNFSLGVGMKLPTGDNKARDLFPNGAGVAQQLRVVDPSIQPGDGGFGLILDLQTFKRVGSMTWFASGGYIIQPDDQSSTLSPPAFLAPAGPGAVAARQRFLSISDQYFGRVGVTHAVPGVKGLGLVLAGRIEGVPINDVMGKTIGFRRPGYTISVEPGLVYTRGNTTVSFTVPIATQRNVQRSLGFDRDSTFPDQIFILSLTHRFRAKGEAKPTASPAPAPAM